MIDAFLAAAREGDFEALVALLDPDAVVRGHRTGARAVAVVGFTIAAGRIVEIDVVADPAKLRGVEA